MHIRDCLSDQQVDQIITIIQNQCDEASRRENAYRLRISQNLYDRLKKGRKAHDITADVYIGFFLAENQIAGIDVEPITNGIYTQPELKSGNTIVHIFHKSNALSSQLVLERANKTDSNYFCILYDLDDESNLKTIDSVHLFGHGQENENLYERPKVITNVS